MSRLSLPSVKLHISDLLKGKRISVDPYNVWINEVYGKEISYTCIWLQGTIVQEKDCMILMDDGTGKAKVNCATAKPVPTNLQIGNYMMVIGELLSNNPLPEVKATKVQHLTNELDGLWKHEIRDIHLHGLIQS